MIDLDEVKRMLDACDMAQCQEKRVAVGQFRRYGRDYLRKLIAEVEAQRLKFEADSEKLYAVREAAMRVIDLKGALEWQEAVGVIDTWINPGELKTVLQALEEAVNASYPDPVTAFNELREVVNGAYDGVDVQALMDELRGADEEETD